jgi:two-component system sensor histidine kinase KdpD
MHRFIAFGITHPAPYLAVDSVKWDKTRRGELMAPNYASPSAPASLIGRQGHLFRFPDSYFKNRAASSASYLGALGRFVKLGRYGAGLALIFLITFFDFSVAGVNAATAGFTLLLAILSASVFWGLGVSVVMSIAAALAFDYLFLPPIGEFTIADPYDWIALSSFLVTAVIGSHLSSRAREQALEANRRRQQVEQLYNLSQRLLRAESAVELCAAIPQRIVEAFGATAAALLLSSPQEEVWRAGADVPELDDERLRGAAGDKNAQFDGEKRIWFAPLRLGPKVIGSVGISSAELSRETMDALGYLIAVTIERAGAIEHVARMEAVRESEHLRSVVMDAITHDFRTPLTCIKASVTGLLEDLEFGREQKKDLLVVIDEECDRIDNLVQKASEMARLESGEAKLRLMPLSVGELISTALAESKSIFRGRPIHFEIEDKALRVLVDLPLARTVLGHLVTNADLYSSPGQPITISTEKRNGFLLVSVADVGPGIEQSEANRIFEKFYRGKNQGFRVYGTGMGLPIARAIVEAHGGTISVTSRPGDGSTFTFSLPTA